MLIVDGDFRLGFGFSWCGLVERASTYIAVNSFSPNTKKYSHGVESEHCKILRTGKA